MRSSGLKIMARLIGLIKPLLKYMVLAITLGILGFLCAIGISFMGAYGITVIEGFSKTSLKGIFFIIGAMAVLRGILHYGEQACNHYIAFKLLAIIRRKVFDALRRLAPAKLEGRKKGDIIAILTSDIELLEVFYAHTISPIIIAILTSIIMLVVFCQYHIIFAVVALAGYVVVGCLIPLFFGRKGGKYGVQYREKFSELNSQIFDSLRGIDEVLQYDYSQKQYEKILTAQDDLNLSAKKLRDIEGYQKGITGGIILIFGMIMLVTGLLLYDNYVVNFDGIIVPTVLMVSSFGPVVALANLSNNLSQTLASGQRVLDILEEKPEVFEITQCEPVEFGQVDVNNVNFSYEKNQVLKNITMKIEKGKITGILGKSGSGKSTLLKLLMRFWKVEKGGIFINNRDINEINTDELRDMQGYVTQETWLFNDTIRENIAVAKVGASLEEVKEAARKAGISQFIEGLPDKYETKVGELGGALSGGERQRLGIARAFLQNGNMILLDEPTSNLDSLNEKYILKSLYAEADKKTVVLVSHRESTMAIADKVYSVDRGKIT